MSQSFTTGKIPDEWTGRVQTLPWEPISSTSTEFSVYAGREDGVLIPLVTFEDQREANALVAALEERYPAYLAAQMRGELEKTVIAAELNEIIKQARPRLQDDSEEAFIQKPPVEPTVQAPSLASSSPQKVKVEDPPLFQKFMQNVAENLKELGNKANNLLSQKDIGLPYNPQVGVSYTGANMVRLMLAALKEGFSDNRWLTKKQLDQVRENNPDIPMQIKPNERGVELLRSEQVTFVVSTDGVEKPLPKGGETSIEGTAVQRTVFYPVTVFNASQIEGFPPKEALEEKLSVEQKVERVENFIAGTAVPVAHAPEEKQAFYSPSTDTVVMPTPDKFQSVEEYTSTKLQQHFLATGHPTREDRPASTEKEVVLEQTKAQVFSMLSAASTGLTPPPAAPRVLHDFTMLSTGETKQLFRAAIDAGRMVAVINSHLERPNQDTGPEWMPAYAERAKLEGDARKKLQGMSWYEGIKNPELVNGFPWYQDDLKVRAESYANAYLQAVKTRKEEINRFENFGLFDQDYLAKIKAEEQAKPLEFSFKHDNEIFNVMLSRDREIIEKSAYPTMLESKQTAKELANANIRTISDAEQAFQSLASPAQEERKGQRMHV